MSEQPIILSSGGGGPSPNREMGSSELLMKVHRMFRGRYLIAGILGFFGAAAGGAAGYLLASPAYTSIGQVRIRTTLPTVLVGDSRPVFNPLELARTHAVFLRDPRVIDLAMRSSAWRGLGRNLDDASKDEFMAALQVITDRENPTFIRVQFTDKEREAAKIAVTEVFNAYRELYGATENVDDPRRAEALRTERKVKETEVQELQGQVRRLQRSFGTTDLRELQKAVTEQAQQWDRAVRAKESQIKLAEARLAGGGDQGAEPMPDPALQSAETLLATAEAMAGQNSSVAQALGPQREAERQLEASRRAGLQPAHPTIRRQQAELDAATAQLGEVVRRQRGVAMGGAGVADLTEEINSPEGLRRATEQLDALRKERDELKQELFKIDDALSQIAGIERNIGQNQEMLRTIDTSLDMLQIEMRPGDNQVRNRIEIMPEVLTPFRPTQDNRTKLGLAGLLLGGGIPVAIVGLLGLLDRRVRYSDDAQDSRSLTLLGVLPYLPNDLQDPEQASVAAHCVHQIRTLLQIGGADHSRRVFAITSPTSGDGKTSLAMSLGLSFAASGARTLVVDCDLIGGGLTSAMGIKTDRGTLDAVLDANLHGHVRSTNFSRLSVLPIGRDDARDVSRLSLELVRNLIRQARDQYDAVIIDTGPILGSLEASLVCAAADGTILTLGRGQARPQAERAIEHLASIGATFLGVVFNRAEANDFKKAVSSASVRSRPLSEEERAARPVGGLLLPQMGPVARIVASHIRPTGDQDGNSSTQPAA